MASRQGVVDYILEQIAPAGRLSCRKMFGKHAIYCDGKLVAVVSDDQLFVKPTSAGRAFIGAVTEKTLFNPPRKYFWIAGDRWDDSAWLSELILRTAQERPPAGQKKQKA